MSQDFPTTSIIASNLNTNQTICSVLDIDHVTSADVVLLPIPSIPHTLSASCPDWFPAINRILISVKWNHFMFHTVHKFCRFSQIFCIFQVVFFQCCSSDCDWEWCIEAVGGSMDAVLSLCGCHCRQTCWHCSLLLHNWLSLVMMIFSSFHFIKHLSSLVC